MSDQPKPKAAKPDTKQGNPAKQRAYQRPVPAHYVDLAEGCYVTPKAPDSDHQ
jgi:hypothetical protein